MEREFSVACLCAEWCDTCVAYRPGFLALAGRFPQAEFRWIDIEEHEEYADYEVENFPTLLIKRGDRELFNGVLLPHHAHLERLLEELIGGKSG
jgi:thiol-disulfide isomerase/thioredoxin